MLISIKKFHHFKLSFFYLYSWSLYHSVNSHNLHSFFFLSLNHISRFFLEKIQLYNLSRSLYIKRYSLYPSFRFYCSECSLSKWKSRPKKFLSYEFPNMKVLCKRPTNKLWRASNLEGSHLLNWFVWQYQTKPNQTEAFNR